MKSLLIKFSGEIFNPSYNNEGFFLKNLILNIKNLKENYNLGIVLGAGNIFRGNQHGKSLGLKPTTGHNAGMMATIINGLILKDLLEQENLQVSLLSSLFCPNTTKLITQNNINQALKNNHIIIFVGGTGNPFFSTDTNAILRALQIESTQVWKCTKVDGIFDSDPEINKNAKLLKNLSYNQIINNQLKFMDLTAITLAQEHKIKIRVFNIFKKDSLLIADKDINFGSTVTTD